MWALYRRLLEVRRGLGLGSLEDRATRRIECREEVGVMTIERRLPAGTCVLVLNFSEASGVVPMRFGAGGARVEVDTSSGAWGGPGGSEGEVSAEGLRISGRSAMLVVMEDGG